LERLTWSADCSVFLSFFRSAGVCPKEEHKHAARTDPVHSGLAGRLPVRL
jgi:hypothetical protein